MNFKTRLSNFAKRLTDFLRTPKLALFGSRKPYCDDNTFFIWEPCSVSHSEVVLGYAKYLIDLGYTVSVVVSPQHVRAGLFCRFQHPRLKVNIMCRGAAFSYFASNGLGKAKGMMLTTAGKLARGRNYDAERAFFSNGTDKDRVYLVEHKIDIAYNAGMKLDRIVALRKMNYKGVNPTVINPNYFGNIAEREKSRAIVKFVMVGSLKPHKRNNALVVEAVKELSLRGINNFKISVIGKGSLKGLPKDTAKFFDIKGQLSFDKMYDEIETSDFFLTAYELPAQSRYATCGTSGNFQLIYGFLKPCIINRQFAPLNNFDDFNAIVYEPESNYADAMERAIKMSGNDYATMRESLKKTVVKINAQSLENLKMLIAQTTAQKWK